MRVMMLCPESHARHHEAVVAYRDRADESRTETNAADLPSRVLRHCFLMMRSDSMEAGQTATAVTIIAWGDQPLGPHPVYP